MFAKLFGTPEDQIVAMLDTNEDDIPCIKIYFKPKDMGVCYACMVFEGSDEGEAEAEKHFGTLDERAAQDVRKEFLRIIQEEEPSAAPMPTPKGVH